MSTEEKVETLERKIDKRRIRKKRSEDQSTIEGTFDTSTIMILYELINKQIIDRLGGVISTGKEANVYNGYAEDGKKFAVKIYRIKTADAKFMKAYIQGDPRFKRVRKKIHDLVFTWAEKEYKNLKRALAAGVRVPEPIHVRKNILVMEFIGKDNLPAPRLKDSPPKKPQLTFNKIYSEIKKLYQKARLVHADLSEYNILMWDGPVIIDISQAVTLEHPNAKEFLIRDIHNILKYFKRFNGIKLPNVKKAFKEITKV
ncbi:MAG: serine protein kinase RIO [Candidatus Helarchaeota archaeon]